MEGRGNEKGKGRRDGKKIKQQELETGEHERSNYRIIKKSCKLTEKVGR